jgi:hypothetical protein
VNKFVAKIASDNGQKSKSRGCNDLEELPIRKFYGVGK